MQGGGKCDKIFQEFFKLLLESNQTESALQRFDGLNVIAALEHFINILGGTFNEKRHC